MLTLRVGESLRISEPTREIKDYCRNRLVLDNPEYENAVRLGKWTGNMDRKIHLYAEYGDDLILPFGCVDDIWKMLPKGQYVLKNDLSPFKACNLSGDINLYPYQKKALEALYEAKNGVLCAPCGSGKTQIGLALIKKIGGKALWLTHTSKLLMQSKERCEKYLKGDFGTITAGKVDIGNDITFATVQTMCNVDPKVYRDAFSVVIVDECHHCVGTPTRVHEFYKVVSNCNCRYKYGMSATLTRQDGLIPCVFALLGNLRHTISESEVGEKIIKAELTRVSYTEKYSPWAYLSSDGMLDYTKMINSICANDDRNRAIANLVAKLKPTRKKQLLLTSRVEHAKKLASMIEGASCVVGSISEKKRNYDASVLVATYALAKEGLDIPELDTLHLLTPIKDPVAVKQSVGRIERNIEGKQKPVAYCWTDEDIDYCAMCFTRLRRTLKIGLKEIKNI